MRHQPFIAPVIAAELGLVVGEIELAREQLGVAGEAGIERVAPAMDDPGVGQDQPDEAEIEEIGRHLVDDAVGGRHQCCEIGEIMLADLGQALGRQRLEEGWVGIRPALAGRVVAGEVAHQIGLAGALDLGMRGQDLLDQRRA